MKFLLDLIPLNVLALILILAHKRGLTDPLLSQFKYPDQVFLFIVAALLLATLSWELVKATILAPKGSGLWVDFTMSFLFFVGLMGYAIKLYYKSGEYPTMDYILLLEAQMLDVIVGFILALSNARRDFSVTG